MKIPRKYFVLSVLLGLLGLVGCGAMGGGLVGSGNVVTETRTVDDFDSIDYSYVGEMILIQGDETSVVIEGDDNVIDNIETIVRGDTLIIDAKKMQMFGGLRSFKKLTFTVTTPDLDELNLSGAGEVRADAFTTEELTIDLSGAGSMSLAQIQTDEFALDLSGAGSIDLTGVTRSLAVDLNGMGSMDAGSFASDTVALDINGAGSATVWARESLDVNISGAGSVDYYGSPAVTRDISGVGSIDSLGEKE